nr:FkbM family methyltransferase [Bacteroidota bacterium]
MSIFIYQEIFIDKAYDLEINTSNPVILDVGGNIGLFALRMKSLYPESRVYSYEPDPDNFNLLLETIEINHLKNIVPVNKAIMDKIGTVKLYLCPTNHAGHSVYKEISGDKFVETETTTLESVFSDNDITFCDLLKLDCEGAEYEILKSLNSEMASKIHTIIYEPTHKLYSVDRLNSLLEELGYSIKKRRQLIIATINKS